MKIILFSFLTLGTTLPAFAQSIGAKLDTLIDAYVHADGFNGTVLAARNGAVILEKGYGYKDKNTKAPNDPNTTVYNYTNEYVFMQKGSAHPISRDSMVARFKDKPLDFVPGQKYSYSNSGYFLLGYIIEKVTGQSYFKGPRTDLPASPNGTQRF